jgi:hypothetical protein
VVNFISPTYRAIATKFFSKWYNHKGTKTQRKEKRVRAVSPEMRLERYQGLPLWKTSCLGVFVFHFISSTEGDIARNFISKWYNHEGTKTQRKEKRVRAVSPEMRLERYQGLPLWKTSCLGVFVVNFISRIY